LNKFYFISSKEPPRDSYLLPPEGTNIEYPPEIAQEIKKAARKAAEALASKNKDGRVTFIFILILKFYAKYNQINIKKKDGNFASRF
jgi:hypothetical protein